MENDKQIKLIEQNTKYDEYRSLNDYFKLIPLLLSSVTAGI